MHVDKIYEVRDKTAVIWRSNNIQLTICPSADTRLTREYAVVLIHRTAYYTGWHFTNKNAIP